MDFSYNKSQQEFRKAVIQFSKESEDVLQTNARELDLSAEFNREGWDKCGAFGIQGGPVPTEFGGGGLDLLTFTAGLEALGENCRDNGLMFSIGAHVLACELPILSFGTQEQKEQWLPDLCSGKKVASIAIAEEQGSSDAFNVQTEATEKDGGYVLNGKKSYITNAPFFDVALVFARISGPEPKVVCLLVDKDTSGLTRAPAMDTIGLKTSPFGDIVFKDCWVDKKNQLGASGQLVFMAAMEWERGCIMAPLIGAMQRQIRECVQRVTDRKQSGESLGTNQAVSHRIVEMKMRAELARLMLYNFASTKQTKRRANQEAVMTKLYASEAILQNSLDAMQIHGGYGYTLDAGYEKEVRDALGLRIASGTSDIQRNIIAKWLKL